MANYKWVSSKGKKAVNRNNRPVYRGRDVADKNNNTVTKGRDAASHNNNTVTKDRNTVSYNNNTVTKDRNAAGKNSQSANKDRYAASKNKKAGKRISGGKIAAIIILVILIGVASFFIWLGYYVKNQDTVLPNVWADGIELSGMTFEEAKQMLVWMGYESNAVGVSATIVFPDSSSFSITGEEAGFSLNAEEAAKAAYEYGKGGSFFENEIAYIRAYRNKTDLRDLSSANFDENYVYEAAAAHTKTYNDTLVNDAININKNNIVIVKGITFAPADEAEVYELTVTTLFQAMSDKTQLNAIYDPKVTTEKEIDLNVLYDTIHVEPVSAVYNPETFSATESSPGVSFDMAAAQALLDRAGMGEEIVIPLVTIEPEVKSEDINSLLFRDVLAVSTTNIGGNSNRLNNVTLAASLIDGTMLNPGEMFSFNEIVGPRTVARGFMEAGAYDGDLVVTEIGGGICQTSSTIYLTVLKCDLQVVERQPHGMTVGYMPLGSDATISWGAIDLKFRNSTEYPIRIETTVVDRVITVTFYGTKLDDNYIKIDQTVISSTAPEYIEREDEEIPQGETKVYTEGATGFVVDTYKLLYDGEDNLISRTLVGRSIYSVQNRVVLIPPILEEDPDAIPEDPDAIPEDPDAIPEDPDAIPEDPDAIPEDPDAIPEDPDATPGGPDATPGDPDATPGDPDATPGDPDAMPGDQPPTDQPPTELPPPEPGE